MQRPLETHLSWLAAALLALSAALPPRLAHAAQSTSTFTVTATVASGCTVSASNLAFGLYDSTSLSDRTASSTISVMCSLGAPYSVGLDLGQYANAGVRRMANGTDRLTYRLFRDAALSLTFGAIGSGRRCPASAPASRSRCRSMGCCPPFRWCRSVPTPTPSP